jgi:cell wall assembly regulator SMI1
MKAVWNRIENWLDKNSPAMKEGLMPGATEDQILAFEELVGVKFPGNVRESMLIHDGQSDLANPLLGQWQLFTIEYAMQDWKLMKELYDQGKLAAPAQADGLVKAQWWNPLWIEVANNGGGDLICIDCDPAPGGNFGQVLIFWHMSPERKVIAPDFKTWLTTFADDLEQGKYTLEYDQLVKKE